MTPGSPDDREASSSDVRSSEVSSVSRAELLANEKYRLAKTNGSPRDRIPRLL